MKGHKIPHGCQVVEALEPQPEGLGARLAIPFAAQEATQRRHQTHSLAQAGRLRGRLRVFGDVSHQGFPLGVCKEDRAGDVGRLTPSLAR